MRGRLTIGLGALILLLTQWGCGFGPPDPLLFDDQGEARRTVSQLEIDEAGIPTGCGELDLTGAEDVVYVPVTDREGDPVLIGIGGQALCVEDEGGADGDEDMGEGLPEVDIEDEIGLDDDVALTLSGTTDEEDQSGLGGTTIGTYYPRNQEPGHHPSILKDPTPEPAGD